MKSLFKRVTALICCITICLMTFAPAIYALDTLGNPVATMNVPDGVTFYTDSGKAIIGNGVHMGDNYDAEYTSAAEGEQASITFGAINVDNVNTTEYISMSRQTIVFYAKTPDGQKIRITGASSVVVEEVTEANTSMEIDAQWKVTVKFSRLSADATLKASTEELPKAQYTVTFPSDAAYRIFVNDEYVNGQVYSVTEGSDLSFRIEMRDTSKQCTVEVDGKELKAVDGIIYTIGNIQGNKNIDVLVEDKKITVNGPEVSDSYRFTGSNSIDYGSSYTFYITPAIGYEEPKVFYKIGNGETVQIFSVGNYQYLIDKNYVTDTITIIVEAGGKNSFTVTAPENEGNFTYYTTSSTTVNKGSAFIFYVTPGIGYEAPVVTYIQGNGNPVTLSPVDGNQYIINNIEGDIKILVSDGELETCEVNLPSGDRFTAEFTGDNTFKYGTDVTFSVTAKPGYEIVSVKATINGKQTTLTGSNGIYTVKVTGDVDIAVETQKASYTITYTYGDGKGTAYQVIEGDDSAESGSNYSFTVQPGAGYGVPVVTVNVNGEAVDFTQIGMQYTFKVTGNTTIEINAGTQKTYSVHAPESNIGYTFILDGENEFHHGDVVNFEVKATVGYEITFVKVNGVKLTVSGNGKYTVTVNESDIDIEVEAKARTYTVKYIYDSNSSAFAVTLGATTAVYGTPYTFTVTAKAGYNAPVVTVNGTVIAPNPISGEYSVLITNDTTINITAGEKIRYNISLIGGSGAAIEAIGTETKVEYGGSFEFKVTVNSMYNAENIVINVNGQPVAYTKNADGSYSYTITNITANQSVTVDGLVKKTFFVSFKTGDGYTLTALGSSTNIPAGEEFSFTLGIAASHTGTPIVLANNNSVTCGENGIYTIIVEANTIIDVTGLELIKFTAAIDASNATVTPIGENIPYGSNFKFTVEAKNGYRVTNVVVNGISVTAVDGEYIIPNVTSAPEIKVVTVANVITVHYVSSDKNHEHDSTETLTIEQLKDYQLKVLEGCAIHDFSRWTADNGIEATVEALRELIRNNDAEITLTAEFSVSESKLEALLSLMKTDTTVLKSTIDGYAHKVVFKTDAKVSVDLTDPCVNDYVKVTGYGSLLASKSDIDFSSAKAALLDRIRDTSVGKIEGVQLAGVSDKIFNYYTDSSITLVDVDGGYIELAIDTNKPGRLYAAGWIELTVGDQHIIIISDVNEEIVVA